MGNFNPDVFLKLAEAKDDPTLDKIKQAESGGRNVPNDQGASSAYGNFQIVSPTFDSLKKTEPMFSDITWDQFKESPAIQREFAAKLKMNNSDRLNKQKLEDNAENQYAMWFTGNTRLLTTDPTAPITDAMSPSQIKANNLSGKTVGEVRSWLANKVSDSNTSKQAPQPKVQDTDQPAPFDPNAFLESIGNQNWAGTGPEMSTKQYLSSGDFGTFARGAVASQDQMMQEADKNVVNKFGAGIKNDPKAYHEQWNKEFNTIKLQQQKQATPPQEAPSLRESLGQLATQIKEHPLQTAKSMVYETGKDLPEYIALGIAGGEGEPAAVSSTIQHVLSAAKPIAKAGVLGAGTNVARQTGEMGLGERQSLDPQEILNQAANFAAFDAGTHALKAAYTKIKGGKEKAKVAPETEVPSTESYPSATGLNEEHMFDAEDLGGTKPPETTAAQPPAEPPAPPPPAATAELLPEVQPELTPMHGYLPPVEEVKPLPIEEQIQNAAEGKNPAGPVPVETVAAQEIPEDQGALSAQELTKAEQNRKRQEEQRARIKVLMTKKPNDPDLVNQIHSMADQADQLGQPTFAAGMRSAVDNNGGFTDPKQLDFYKQRLSEYQQQAGTVAERPQETNDLNRYFEGMGATGKPSKRLNEFLPNAPQEVQDTVAKSNKYIQDLTNKVNALGYKVEDVGHDAPKLVRDMKDKMSQIAGSSQQYIINAEHIAKDNRHANPEKLASLSDRLGNDFNESDTLLGATVDQAENGELPLTQAEINQQRQIAQRSETAKRTQANQKIVDPANDDILSAMAKLGGVDINEAKSEFDLDPADMKKQGAGVRRSFHTGDNVKSLDTMRESLVHHGYMPEGSTVADFGNTLHQALSGEKVLSIEGIEHEQKSKYEQYLQDQEAQHLELTGQTEAQIQADKVAQQRAATEESRQANAPTSEGFNLTGSNREADVAAAHGAQDMFATQPETNNGLKETPKEVGKYDIGNMVKIEKPGTQDVIAGTITKKLNDGRLEVRTQNDGYHYVDRMEVIDDVTHSQAHPEAHAEVNDDARDNAVQERVDELEQEHDAEHPYDPWADPDHIPFNREPIKPREESIPGHDNPYSVTKEETQRTPSLRIEINRVNSLHEQGKITDEQFTDRVKGILSFTKKEGSPNERTRGAEIIKERLQRALRNGDLGKDAVRLAEWFVTKNPQLVDDLGVSIREAKKGEEGSGFYTPLARIMTLFKGGDSDVTPIHEILHHTERMMPEPLQNGIRKAWAQSFTDAKKAADKGTDKNLKDYYNNLVKYHLDGDAKALEEVHKLLANGDVAIEHYQHYNPSEFWAVNGSDIMANRFTAINRGLVARISNWLKEFTEKVKSILGLKSDHAIIKALDSLQKGDGKFVTEHMLTDTDRYQNYDKKEADALNKEFDSMGIPQATHHGEEDLKDQVAENVDKLKNTLKGTNNPAKVNNTGVSGLQNALTNFQIANIYGGMGLEKAEARRYNNKIFKEVTDEAGQVHKVAIASVAQMNALHAGHIGSQVMLLGKLTFDTTSKMFKAVADKYSMRNVFLAERAIYKKLGRNAGSTLMQSYLEAKRTRSIQNGFMDRQAELERAIAAGEDPEKAQQDFDNVALIYRDKLPKYFVSLDSNEKIIRNKEGFPIINDDAIDFIINKDKKYPELKTIMDNWTAVNKNLVDALVFGGVISKARGEGLKAIEDYVPWNRIGDDVESPYAPHGGVSGLTNVSKEKRFARGQVDKQINNIISNMVNNVMMMTRNSARNYAALKIAAEFGTKKENGKLAIFKSEETMADGALRTNILMNGKRVIIEIKDPLVAQAMLGMESMELPMMKYFSAANQFVRRGITMMPAFQLFQVIKDAPTAAAVTGLKNPALAVGKIMGSFFMALNPKDDIVKILKSYGVGGYKLAGRTAESEFALAMKVQNHNLWSGLLSVLDHIGDASDYAQRRIIYKEVLKRTGSETEAVFAANQIIDFMRHGNSALAQAEVKCVAFMGAYANQIDVLGDAITGRRLAGVSKGKAAANFYKATATFTTLAMIYTMYKISDPDYQKLDDQTKARNYIFGNLKIPMSTSYSFFFKSIPEFALNYIITHGTTNEMDATRLRKAITTAAMDQLLGPNPIPSLIKPPIEIITNHDFFTGGNVVPKGLENLQPFEQFNSSTSEFGKMLSATMNGVLNPIQTDYLVKGWFSTVGMMVQWASDMFTSDKPEKAWNQNPFVGQFVLPTTPHGPEERFYDLKQRSDVDYNTWTTMLKRQRPEEAAKFFKENKSTIVLHDYVSQSEAALKNLNSEINRLSDVPASVMNAANKTKQINYYKAQKNQILTNVNQFRLMAERGQNFTIPE